MTDRLVGHDLGLNVSQWFPARVAAGAALTFKVRVDCPLGCDLRGTEISVMAPQGPVVTGELVTWEEGINETGALTLRAPAEVGEHEWSVSTRPRGVESPGHAGTGPLPPFATEAHGTSLAVWDLPSPAVTGEPFVIKVGARCAEGCDLQGRAVEIRDGSGDGIATAELGKAFWSGSDGLQWTEVELVAPNKEGVASWSVDFSAADMDLPHRGASSGFSFATTKAPDHRLTVEVVESDSAAPVPNAVVSLGAYRASTDASGRTMVAVAEGTYELLIWKVGYEAPSRTLEVRTDLTVRVEAVVLPDRSSWEDD